MPITKSQLRRQDTVCCQSDIKVNCNLQRTSPARRVVEAFRQRQYSCCCAAAETCAIASTRPAWFRILLSQPHSSSSSSSIYSQPIRPSALAAAAEARLKKTCLQVQECLALARLLRASPHGRKTRKGGEEAAAERLSCDGPDSCSMMVLTHEEREAGGGQRWWGGAA